MFLFAERLLEPCCEFVVFESPAGGGEKGCGRLRDEAFEYDVGTQAGEEVAEEPDVFFYGEEVEVGRMLCVFRCHEGATDELELVYLQGVDGQGGEDVGFAEEHVAGFAGESEDDMCSDGYAATGCAPDGIDGLPVGVSAADAKEGLVIDGFDAVFYDDGMVEIEVGKEVEHFVAYAVGARADDYAVDKWYGEGFFVFGFELG